MPNALHLPLPDGRLRITAVALPILLIATGAAAQERIRGLDELNGRETTGAADPARPMPQAPVGHRQPRAADIPSTTGSGTAGSFDEKIRQLSRDAGRGLNLCRGC